MIIIMIIIIFVIFIVTTMMLMASEMAAIEVHILSYLKSGMEAPAEDVFAGEGGETRDLRAPAARESENPFELQNDHREYLGSAWRQYLVSE